ncbi:MAG: hypothetical protein ABJB32_07610, partial [Verrucomicrobiota bacterium]
FMMRSCERVFRPSQKSKMKNTEMLALILTVVGTACWGVCFWWMHRLSTRQERMLQELHDVTKRIEKLSKVEHDLLREVHPVVGEIKESVQDVAEAVSPDGSPTKTPGR